MALPKPFSENISTSAPLHFDHAHSSIEEWNLEYAKKYLVGTCFQILFLALGLTGNLFIIYIYQTRQHRKREGRFFIVLLAVVDLLHCIASSSLVFVKNTRPVLFPSSWSCKILIYSTNMFFILSLLVLVLICVERYQRVCRPFTTQMSRKTKYLATAFTVFLAAIFPVPRLVYFEVRQINLTSLIGNVCAPNMGMAGARVVIPGVAYANFIVSFAAILVLALLYSFVGRVIIRQNKRFHRVPSKEQSGTSENSHSFEHPKCETQLSNSSASLESNRNRLRLTGRKVLIDQDSIESTSSPSSVRRHPDVVGTLSNSRKRAKSLAHVAYETVRLNRSTIMFMMITLVTILSYIPLWIFVLFDIMNPKRWYFITDSELHLFLFLRSLSVVSFLSNPFIYAYYDRKFRKSLKKMLIGSCQKKKKKQRPKREKAENQDKK